MAQQNESEKCTAVICNCYESGSEQDKEEQKSPRRQMVPACGCNKRLKSDYDFYRFADIQTLEERQKMSVNATFNSKSKNIVQSSDNQCETCHRCLQNCTKLSSRELSYMIPRKGDNFFCNCGNFPKHCLESSRPPVLYQAVGYVRAISPQRHKSQMKNEKNVVRSRTIPNILSMNHQCLSVRCNSCTDLLSERNNDDNEENLNVIHESHEELPVSYLNEIPWRTNNSYDAFTEHFYRQGIRSSTKSSRSISPQRKTPHSGTRELFRIFKATPVQPLEIPQLLETTV